MKPEMMLLNRHFISSSQFYINEDLFFKQFNVLRKPTEQILL